ncbi:MAG: efflux RND transporter permease subunit, partial [Burkholderiales bacterium]
MFLPEISVKRPVLATVMSLLIVLIGIIAFDRLTVREYPKIDTPVVSVRTVYTGASPQVIESQVTQPLEDSISGIEGVKTLKSVSREEVSQITVEFTNDRNPDLAASDVRDRVSRARDRLPLEVKEPIIAKVEVVTRGDVRLEVFAQGKGRIIVLLPSLGRGAEDFAPMADAFERDGFRVHVRERAVHLADLGGRSGLRGVGVRLQRVERPLK